MTQTEDRWRPSRSAHALSRPPVRRLPWWVKAPAKPVRTIYLQTTSARRPLPQAIIIGAQKCGTTALFSYLSEHPMIIAPRHGGYGAGGTVAKEVHYFDAYYRNGPIHYRSKFPTYRTLHRAARAHGGRPLPLEASPGYLIHPLAPYRVRGLLPNAKFIVVLRDPVERALSAHHQQVLRGFETLRFEDAVAKETERLAGELERLRTIPLFKSYNYSHFGYLMRGRYAEQLERWFAVFAREQFLVIESGALRKDPAGVADRVCGFLGLAPAQQATAGAPVGSRSYEDMSPALRDELRSYFAPHNARLFELLGERFEWGAPEA